MSFTRRMRPHTRVCICLLYTSGMDNVLSRFLLGELYTGGAAVSYLHFRVREVLPVQNLVENMVWTLVNRQPGARRINQVTMGLLLLQLMHYKMCIRDRIIPSRQ